MVRGREGRIVKVVPYDIAWENAFREEEKNLRRVLGEEICEVYHIGSTAIPGICAKPVIDILVVVKDIAKVDCFNGQMADIGYVAMGEYGIKGRRYFPKGGDRRTHHVHIFESGSPEIDRHIRFRDFMRSHPKEAAEYDKLKRDLAAQFPMDIDSYCDGKDEFIRGIDEKAEEWAKARKR